MTVFTSEHTARKRYWCSRCGSRIEPGERYKAYAIPPGSDIGNETWIRGHEHLSPGDCWVEITHGDRIGPGGSA